MHDNEIVITLTPLMEGDRWLDPESGRFERTKLAPVAPLIDTLTIKR